MRIIRADNIKKKYGNINVLNGIDLEIHEGEFVGIMGKSGSGKTTLLKILGMIEPATDGMIYYGEEKVHKLSDRELSRIRREELGFVFQEFFLMESMSVFENILLPLYISKTIDQNRKRKAKELMEMFQISELEAKMPNELSGGERQRTAICRALINNPNIILADEPTGNLDSKSGRIVIESFKKINLELKKTIIMVTHDPQMASYCERVMLMKDGKIIKQLKRTEEKDFYKTVIESMVEL